LIAFLKWSSLHKVRVNLNKTIDSRIGSIVVILPKLAKASKATVPLTDSLVENFANVIQGNE
jgi:hypothetical protein